MKFFLSSFLVLMVMVSPFAQVGVNPLGNAPDPSAGLDIDFDNKGLLPPRMSSAERNAIVDPAPGLRIYNFDTACENYYNGAINQWVEICGTPVTECVVGAVGPGGGRIFYCGDAYPEYVGLEAATTDQSTAAGWGCASVGIVGAESSAIGWGNQNTTDVMNGCATAGIAARLCGDLSSGGFGDWFLPSRDELNLMYTNLHLQSLGGFTAVSYWSSSEASGQESGTQNFSTGAFANTNKGTNARVRAIRRF